MSLKSILGFLVIISLKYNSNAWRLPGQINCSDQFPEDKNVTVIGSVNGEVLYTTLEKPGLNYERAIRFCEYNGLQPAIIDSPEKDLLIRDFLIYLRDTPTGQFSIRFTLNNRQNESTYLWYGSDGPVEATYFNWNEGYPHTYSNCVYAHYNSNTQQYGWSNVACDSCRQPLCSSKTPKV